MKKLLIIVLLSILGLSSVQAANMEQYILKHTNPLPNLMRVAIKHARALDITDAQMKEMKAWQAVSKPKIKVLVRTVIEEERMLRQEALTTDVDVIGKAQKMLDTRKAIIELKTQCRMHLKTILNEKQYKELVKIYTKSRKH